MKRIVIVLALCLVVALLPGCKEETPSDTPSVGLVSHDVFIPTEDATVSLGELTAAAGETVSVDIMVTAGSGIAAADFIIEYDTNVLSYQSFVPATVFQNGYSLGNEIQPGKVKTTMVTLDPPTEAGSLGTVTFKVKDGAAAGSYPLTLTCETCCDYESTDLNPKIVSGKITVK